MNSREAILQRIRSELAGRPAGQPPPVPEVWPRSDPGGEQLIDGFTAELEAVQGEVVRCGSIQQAQARLADLMEQAPRERIGAADRAICRQVLASLPAERVCWASQGLEPQQMAGLAAGVVTAEWLLADTGTCVIECNTPQERVLCYLPPACVVIAAADRLREHLPSAWEEIARQTADPSRRGEFVLITGPSRTADIEKILILGVHGPKRLVVLLLAP